MDKNIFNDIEKINYHVIQLIKKIDDPIVKNEATRLVNMGGKRLRPLFLLWSSKTKEGISDKVYQAAAALELLHTSSLIHDDIIDASDLRRGTDTTSKIYGKERATSIGTVLSLFAIEEIAAIEEDNVSTALANALESLCLGEIKQLNERFNFNCTSSDYFERISHKTASLFALPCKIGGILSEGEHSYVDKISQVGFNIGCSFQILDDILDIDPSLESKEKEQFQDLKSGVITLPYILLAKNNEKLKKKLLSLTSTSNIEDFNYVTEAASTKDILNDTFRVSNQFLDNALDILSTIDSFYAKDEFDFLIKKLYKSL